MADGTGKALPLHVQIGRKLQGDVSIDWLNCSIFKVPNHLRQISEQAYEPQVIAIGPYHHHCKNHQLEKMEVYKTFYLKMLLRRRRERSLERYVTALKGMEEKARKFYSDPMNHSGGENFVEMMLLDGCFIIELIRKIAMKQRDPNDHLLTHSVLRRAMLDLLLVENQLPFFILSKLFAMTVMPDDEEKDFMKMTINFLSMVMPLPESQISRPKNEDIEHLLDLLYYCWTHQDGPIPCSQGNLESLVDVGSLSPKAKLNLCSSEVVQSSPPEPSEEVRVPLLSTSESFLPEVRVPLLSTSAASVSFSPEENFSTSALSVSYSVPYSSKEVKFLPSNSCHLCNLQEMDAQESDPLICSAPPKSSTVSINPKRKEWRFILSATELREEGINFQKIEGRLFNIQFQKGKMSIPTLIINDDTESILRNLVAYEQCFKRTSPSGRPSPKYFTDYITFMDCLINTGKDVELLCRRKVIDNWLGDHEVVAAIFNKLRKSVSISEENFSYAETFDKVNEHCDRKWNQWKANLWHNYFNTPWAGISFFAAVFLLLLTVLQSVYSVLSYQFN